MKNLFKFKLTDKALVIPLIFSFILLIVVFGIAYISFTQKPQKTNPIPTTTPIVTVSQLSVTHVIPDEPQPLASGIPHTFLIYFSQNISVNEFTINLDYTNITQDNPQTITVPLSLSLFSPKVIEVKATIPIVPQSEYYLTIADKQTGQTLSQTNYLSGDLQPTSVPSNNETLKKYLPYETNSYMLEYLSNQNLYIFHFKYDPSSSLPLDQQYENAKAQAVQFIESKGVDINSIIIDFRSS
jgi:hypothetical protein